MPPATAPGKRQPREETCAFDLVGGVEALRVEAASRLHPQRQRELGQYLTPAPVSRLLASTLRCETPVVSVLDAGAGVGSLFTALVDVLCLRPAPPQHVHVTAYEIDPMLAEYADRALRLCGATCEQAGIGFSGEVRRADFLRDALRCTRTDLFGPDPCNGNDLPPFTCAIQNPPYRKINSNSEPRLLLRQLGIETTNLYTGFLFATTRLLANGGELAAITPRSFCNGLYFRPFREAFLSRMALQRMHLFETRQEAFKGDGVLQETLILRATKQASPPEWVTVSSGLTADEDFSWRETPYRQIVKPGDPQSFIHVVTDGRAKQIADSMARMETPLAALGLEVSTGRVVDFRAAKHLRPLPQEDTAPLIWPSYVGGGAGGGKNKAAAISVCPETRGLLVPNGNYVLVKRFSAKEQAKRLMAGTYEGRNVPEADPFGIGFENHLNYFHARGQGMSLALARGLSVFLNSTLADEYFRLFSGHTQVNATDLRNIRYPTRDQLLAVGREAGETRLSQQAIDHLIGKALGTMGEAEDAIQGKAKLEEALSALVRLGLPRAQQNERSALTLLALLDLKPDQPWSEAGRPLLGITPIMDFISKQYGKNYAPNTRETVRRSTVHQFLEAGLLVANPDDPSRAVNSSLNAYQIEINALGLLRTFGTAGWEQNVEVYLSTVQTLQARYAQERKMQRIPVQIAPGQTITLSPGGQNVLVERIIEDFCPYYVPGGKLLYVGDTDEKFAYFDQGGLTALGVTMDEHGKMPDLIVHHVAKDWLILIEAVTSHGPVNAKRHAELRSLFRQSRIGLVFVTAFLTRQAFRPYSAEISWETEVWTADAPTHLTHFNGERFLGPYPEPTP